MEKYENIKRNNELFEKLKNYPENSKEYREIVSKIVENNLPLVIHVAKKYFPMMGSMLSGDDLITEGYFGLLNAIKLFKPEKEIPFANYAGLWIDGYVLRRIKQEQNHKLPSLQDNVLTSRNDADKPKLEGFLASPINIEADIVEKDEIDRKMAWIRKNLDQLKPFQKQVISLKYLSGEAVLTNRVVAKKLNCTYQNISLVDNKSIAKLRKMYYESHPEEIETKQEEIELTREEKIAAKEVLKSLILTKLAPQQKRTTLCKFFSATIKTDKQVAEEINSTVSTVNGCIQKVNKKLCALYNRIPDQKHLTSEAIKNILQSRIEESEKER